jgi:hypothetical protein
MRSLKSEHFKGQLILILFYSFWEESPNLAVVFSIGLVFGEWLLGSTNFPV